MGGICRVEFDNGLPISEGGNDAPDLEQAKANARLIAAAPDLLEALEDMLAQADFAASVRGGEGHMKHAMAKARAAIVKAKGE